MALNVRLHALLRIERVVAYSAFVNLLAVVRDLVELQDVVVSERLPADVARVRLFPSVGPGVYFELFRTCKAFCADAADVGFFAGVGAHVDDQLAGLDEGFGADGAFVRPLAGVYPHVAVELAGMLKSSGANLEKSLGLGYLSRSKYVARRNSKTVGGVEKTMRIFFEDIEIVE